MKTKTKKFSKLFIIIPAIVIIAMAVLFLCIFKKPMKRIVLYSEAKYVINSFDIKSNGAFSVGFVHSVNKSPVVDYYRIDDKNNIYLFRTVYYNYGAGVPTDLEPGQKLTYGENGSMIIDGIDKKIDNLSYYLSEESDHILTVIGDKAYSLWQTCGQNVTVTIKIEG